jgi:hypothetical protein
LVEELVVEVEEEVVVGEVVLGEEAVSNFLN